MKLATSGPQRLRTVALVRACSTVAVTLFSLGLIAAASAGFGLPYAFICALLAAYSLTTEYHLSRISRYIPDVPEPRPSYVRSLVFEAREIWGAEPTRRFLVLSFLLGFLVLPLQIFYAKEVIGLPQAQLVYLFAAGAGVGILTNLLLSRVGKHREPCEILAACLVGLGANVVLMAAFALAAPKSTALPLQLGHLALLLATNVFVSGIGSTWYSAALEAAPAAQAGTALMMFGLAFDVAALFAAAVGGQVIGHAGSGGPPVVTYLLFIATIAFGVRMLAVRSNSLGASC